MLARQAIDAFLKLHVFYLQNEVIFGKPPHPLLTHVTQPVVSHLTVIVACNVHFLLAYPGMHQVQCVDLPGSGHDQAPFAELHNFVLDATCIAFII